MTINLRNRGCLPGPLTPGRRLLFRFLWVSRSLDVGADVLFLFGVRPVEFHLSAVKTSSASWRP